MLRHVLFLSSLLVSPTHSLSVSPSWVREAEIKHGRVAMLAVPCLLSLSDDPVSYLNSLPISSQISFYSAAGVLESINLARITSRPGGRLDLKVGERPGLLMDDVAPSPLLQKAEDWTGRAAMLVATGYLVGSLG